MRTTVWRVFLALVLSIFQFATVHAQSISVTRESGGGVQTNLFGYGTILNKDSTLSREWITVHDQLLPADLEGTVGVRTVYESGRVSGSYFYEAKYTIKAKEPLTAIDVRFLVFDVWGNHIRTLVATQLVDISAGVSKAFNGKWNLFSENEASDYFASVAYISRVRTKAGRVIEGNRAAVLTEAKKFARKLTEEDLEPKREKK